MRTHQQQKFKSNQINYQLYACKIYMSQEREYYSTSEHIKQQQQQQNGKISYANNDV